MRKIYSALAALTLALVGRALLPSTAQAAGGYWAQTCCGTQCASGDYCIGSGSYTCCK